MKNYEEAELEIILLVEGDVITASDDEIPIGGDEGDH